MKHLLAIALLGATALAGGSEAITLDEALSLAMERNPDLAASRRSAEGQTLRAEAALRERLPRIGIVSDTSYGDEPARVFAEKLNRGAFGAADFDVARLNNPDPLFHVTTAVKIEAPVDLFGKIRDRAGVHAAVARAAGSDAAAARQELRMSVVRTYLNVGLARSAVDVTVRSVEGAQAREADLESRVTEGAALPADLLRARARRREREAELAEARANADVAVALLHRQLAPPEGVTYVPAAGPSDPEPIRGGVETWHSRGRDRRPEILGARERLQAAEQAERLTRWEILPDVALYGVVADQRGGGAEQNATIGAVLTFATFDPTRSRRRGAVAADVEAARQALRAATAQVDLEIESSYRRAEASRERFAAAAGGAVEGREALSVVRERRRAGIATLTDELETEAMSLALELGELRAAADVAVADAALSWAAGEL